MYLPILLALAMVACLPLPSKDELRSSPTEILDCTYTDECCLKKFKGLDKTHGSSQIRKWTIHVESFGARQISTDKAMFQCEDMKYPLNYTPRGETRKRGPYILVCEIGRVIQVRPERNQMGLVVDKAKCKKTKSKLHQALVKLMIPNESSCMSVDAVIEPGVKLRAVLLADTISFSRSSSVAY